MQQLRAFAKARTAALRIERRIVADPEHAGGLPGALETRSPGRPPSRLEST